MKGWCSILDTKMMSIHRIMPQIGSHEIRGNIIEIFIIPLFSLWFRMPWIGIANKIICILIPDPQSSGVHFRLFT